MAAPMARPPRAKRKGRSTISAINRVRRIGESRLSGHRVVLSARRKLQHRSANRQDQEETKSHRDINNDGSVVRFAGFAVVVSAALAALDVRKEGRSDQ